MIIIKPTTEPKGPALPGITPGTFYLGKYMMGRLLRCVTVSPYPLGRCARLRPYRGRDTPGQIQGGQGQREPAYAFGLAATPKPSNGYTMPTLNAGGDSVGLGALDLAGNAVPAALALCSVPLVMLGDAPGFGLCQKQCRGRAKF